jgi:ferredoxin
MQMIKVTIDGSPYETREDQRLIDVINRSGAKVPQVCYHPQLGPIQTCDTCMVEIDGQLVRACATRVAAGMQVLTKSARADAAQRLAFDRILGNHLLYCTVCDNNNGNCTVHNTTRQLAVEHQQIPYRPKPYGVDNTNPFYRYDPDQCILCGRCVEACQNLQVNETLSINWEDPHPRVQWDHGSTIGESSCVSCGHCVSVCPCNALMEKSMIGHAGYFTALPKPVLDGMIDVVKEIEPEVGYGAIMQLSEDEEAMREHRIRRTKTVCTYCGVGCSFEVWTKDRHILKVEPLEGPANGVSTCVKGKFGWDFVNSPDRLTTPLIRENGKFRGIVGRSAGPGRPQIRGNQSAARTGRAGLCFLFEMHQRRKLSDAKIGAGSDRHQQHGQLFALLPGACDHRTVSDCGVWRRFRFDPRYRARRVGTDHRQQHCRKPPGASDSRETCPQTPRPEIDRFGLARKRDGSARRSFPASQARDRHSLALRRGSLHIGRGHGRHRVYEPMGEWVGGI